MTTVEILKEMAFTATETQRRALEDAISALSETEGDLISRQAVMDCFKKWQPYMATRLYEFEKELTAIPSVENKGEFDGMTNGEAMNHVLRKTFPRIIFIRGINECNKTKSIVYAEEWENAPYKAERNEE